MFIHLFSISFFSSFANISFAYILPHYRVVRTRSNLLTWKYYYLPRKIHIIIIVFLRPSVGGYFHGFLARSRLQYWRCAGFINYRHLVCVKTVTRISLARSLKNVVLDTKEHFTRQYGGTFVDRAAMIFCDKSYPAYIRPLSNTCEHKLWIFNLVYTPVNF